MALHPGRASGMASAAHFSEKIKDLEAELKDLRQGSKRKTVFGGLSTFDSESVATEWLKLKLKEVGADAPTEIYGFGFVPGPLFGKFANVDARSSAVTKYGRARLMHEGLLTCGRAHKPLKKRVPEPFLLGLKKVIVQPSWGYNNYKLNVDEKEGVLKLAGQVVVTVSVNNDTLSFKWHGEWTAWREFIDDPEIEAIKEHAKDTLARASPKGGGKGKKGSNAE